jgi:hypothetical protein
MLAGPRPPRRSDQSHPVRAAIPFPAQIFVPRPKFRLRARSSFLDPSLLYFFYFVLPGRGPKFPAKNDEKATTTAPNSRSQLEESMNPFLNISQWLLLPKFLHASLFFFFCLF